MDREREVNIGICKNTIKNNIHDVELYLERLSDNLEEELMNNCIVDITHINYHLGAIGIDVRRLKKMVDEEYE